MRKMTLSERTQKILDDMRIKQTDLAALAGITRGAVNQWLASKPDATMKPLPAYAIADKTTYQPRWLMIGEGPERSAGEASGEAIQLAHKIMALPPDKRALLNLIFDAPPAGETTDLIKPKQPA